MTPDANVLSAMRCLIDHWSANPLACDTLEGIRRWWVGPDRSVTRDDVVAALAWLEQQGVIESLAAADGRVRFRRAASFDAAALAQQAEAAAARTTPRRKNRVH